MELTSINERIAYVIETSGLNKSAFAKRINVTPAFMSLVCKGGSSVSDRTIADICREFGIDEVWLRTGEGSMIRVPTRREEIAAYMGELLGGQRTEAEEILIATMSRLSPEAIATLNRLLDHISHEWAEQIGEERWRETQERRHSYKHPADED